MAILLVASATTHFMEINQPTAVIFDEVHFGSFADAYCCSGAYFFDVHPPHGKLLAALGLKLGGYAGGQDFATIGTQIYELQPWLLRLVPALAGSLIPILVFAILHQLGASARAAFLGGWAVLFDNALLLQTRVLALDGIMIFFMLAAISLALLAARQGRLRGQLLASIGAGVCAGMAFGAKFTGLTSAAVVVLILWFAPRPIPGIGRPLGMILIAGLAGIVVYLGGWVLHFILLDQPGPGDIWGRPSGVIWRDILKIHQQMFSANYGLGATHSNGSPWWAWPFSWRPIYYYAQDNTALYLVGNPVVWWGSTLGILAILVQVLRQGLTNTHREPYALMLIPFAISYLPYMLIPRVLFLYHYLPSLVFAVMAVVLWLDRSGRLAVGNRAYIWLLVLTPTGFLLISPFTFGFPLPEAVLTWMRDLVH